MPNMTAKELSALEDLLGAERTLVKKFTTYAQMATDPTLKNKCQQVARQHQNHYDRLFSHLN